MEKVFKIMILLSLMLNNTYAQTKLDTIKMICITKTYFNEKYFERSNSDYNQWYLKIPTVKTTFDNKYKLIKEEKDYHVQDSLICSPFVSGSDEVMKIYSNKGTIWEDVRTSSNYGNSVAMTWSREKIEKIQYGKNYNQLTKKIELVSRKVYSNQWNGSLWMGIVFCSIMSLFTIVSVLIIIKIYSKKIQSEDIIFTILLTIIAITFSILTLEYLKILYHFNILFTVPSLVGYSIGLIGGYFIFKDASVDYDSEDNLNSLDVLTI